jgi:L-aspartate semialdehyde sulfurtransferase
MSKTIEEINKKIEKGTVRVIRADEMTALVKEIGHEKAAEEIDVVTTGTFGAMCSSGVFLNFGHSDPPIRMTKVYLNNVEAYSGVAAVDAYLGATQNSEDKGIKYGGAHVIEDLIKGEEIILQAVSYGTDCYPRKEILTTITIDDLNSAIMLNPRNAYQKYNAAVNTSEKPIYTYMGQLLPKLGNINFSGAGEISPLMNDPEYRTIGTGTRIFLGGAQGYIVGGGTQHNPSTQFGTLMVQGDLKQMTAEYIRAASFKGYGCSLFVGIGIPIPILNAEIAKFTAISDDDIIVDIIDYSIPSRSRPSLKKVSYKELKSGSVEIDGKKIQTSPISSFHTAKKISELLKDWIKNGKFFLTSPVTPLPKKTVLKGLECKSPSKRQMEDNAGISGLIWDEERCTHCGLCINICPVHVFERLDDWNTTADTEKCTSCGECIELCPVQALELR